MSEAVIRPAGDSALLVEFENEISLEVNSRVRALKYTLEESPFEGMGELIPAYRSLLIGYDPLKIRMKIDLAIDELIANVANYAYASGKGEVTVRFAFDEADRMVSITFIDEGVPYDPLKKRDPDVTLSAAERQIGGLGIFLVKKTMDSMEYKRENDCNILTIYKKI